MRLRRDFVGLIFGGLIGQTEFGLLFFGVFSLGYAIADGNATSITFATILLGLWVLLEQVRVELRDDYLVAGFKWHPKRWKRADIEKAEIGKVWSGRGQLRGVKLVLKTGERVDLPLSAVLLADRLGDWISAINQWAGYEPQTVDRSSTPLGRFLTDSRNKDQDDSGDTPNEPPNPA